MGSLDFAVTKVPATTSNHVFCHLSSQYNRKAHPDPSVEDNIEREWRRRLDANPHIFNGSKFRLKAMRRDSHAPGPSCLTLQLGLTDYCSYLGTNASSYSGRLIRDGLDHHGDKEAYLSMKLGVGSVTRTSDEFLVFILRSSHVAEAQGMVDVPGGHPEPERIGLHGIHSLSSRGVNSVGSTLCELTVAEIFDSAFEEVVAETNAPRQSLCGGVDTGSSGGAVLMGMVNQLHTAGTPAFAFGIRCSLTRTELEARYLLGAKEAEESLELVFSPVSSLIGNLKQEDLVTTDRCIEAVLCFEREQFAPMRLTPSTRGCLTLYLAHAFGVSED